MTPEYYAYNCPWFDWTTPSESAQLFHDTTTTTHVDKVSHHKEVLVIRRGTETLTSLVHLRIHLTSDKMFIKLTVTTR